jgi:putative tricarboxylic transport membrane protein
MSSPAITPAPRWRPLAIVGAILLVLALVIWRDIARMPPAQAVGVGPAVGMRLVSGLLLILAVAHGIAAWRAWAASRLLGQQPEEVIVQANLAALAWAIGGLVGMIVVIQVGGGFVIGSTWLFAATAKAFGKPLGWRSIGIGLLLAVAVYAFFTEALSLSLPAGPLEHLFQG